MDLNALQTFVAVATHGSFSRAATELGIAKSTASQRVRELEASLGVQLLLRTTRSINLTEAGAALLERGREIVGAAAEIERRVATLRETPVGHLRVSAPVSFGQRFIGAVVASLLGEHPGLSMHLDLEDRDADLIGERYDVAVRVGTLPASGLSARRIGRARWFVVGAPSYLERRGRPSDPEALRGHECLRFAHRRTPGVWTLGGSDRRRDVRVEGRLVCNHGDVLAETAAAGLGLAWLPDFVSDPYVLDGRLERVLEAYCDTEAPIHLVFPERRHRALEVRLFVEALEAALAPTIAA